MRKRNPESNTKRILEEAERVLKTHPDGIQYTDLCNAIKESNNSLNLKTIGAVIWKAPEQNPNVIKKISRGIYIHPSLSNANDYPVSQGDNDGVEPSPNEEQFYKPFAEWLETGLEEVSKAIPLGRNVFRDKWGTPDVIGKRESKRSDIIQMPVEIVSAEVKVNTGQLVTAFGQACAYCLFSHKSYLVVPKSTPTSELARLDSMCQVFGIGLVLFESDKPEAPEFAIRVRARKQDPDHFYMNEYMKRIERKLWT